MKSTLKLFAISVIILLCSCGGSTTAATDSADSAIEEAAAALDVQDINAAISICDRLTEGPDSATLTPEQYCQIAGLYAKAAESRPDNETIMAHALGALSRAYAKNPQVVNDFISNLPVDEMRVLDMTRQLIDAHNVDLSDYIDATDSVSTDSL